MDDRHDPLRPTATGQAYIERALALLGDRSALDILAQLDDRLDELLATMPTNTLASQEAPGKWSVIEVVHHLADTELVYGHRLRVVLTTASPHHAPFDQARWTESFGYAAAPLPEARAILTALRASHLRILSGLSPADRDRAGIHATRGRETLDLFVRLWAGHDLLHQAQIERIRLAVSECA